MRALVLGGAGAVCRETTRDLARHSDFAEIVVADHDLNAAERLVRSIGDPRLKPIHFDAADFQAMLDLFPRFAVVVNGLPFKYDYAVNKACVEVGVNGLDLSSEDPQFALDEAAAQKGMLFVPGMGATPGTTNMMVRRASEVLERMDTVEISFAAFRCLAPAPGLLETTLWEFNPEVRERQAVYFEAGAWHPAPPLFGGKRVRFHGQIGEQEVFLVPHDEVSTLPGSFPALRKVSVRGCFPPHVMELMQALLSGGLLSSRLVSVSDAEAPSIEVVRALLLATPFARQNPIWAYGLVVEVTGERNGRSVQLTYRNRHPPQDDWEGASAYFKNVGIPLSIGAQLIAGGHALSQGVKPPELAFPTQPFFSELGRRGILIEEEIAESGTLD